ncbi:hypothetical protein GCM10025734_02330 [Kitasatospora paranensis]|uniref:hypothetical protein n=1 Tax=Kitasatospora paranensis TaxID=258053 RepID=UPI0031E553D7
MFAGVAQGLSREAEDGEPVGRGGLLGCAVDDGLDVLPRVSGLLDHLFDVPHDRHGPVACASAGMQGAQHVTQVGQGVRGSGPQQREAFDDGSG